MNLIAEMLVKNEADRYLQEVLTDLETYVDKLVIVDNNSIDDTYKICQSFKKVIKLEKSDIDFKTDELGLRSYLLNIIKEVAHDGDWIIAIDADEIFEDKFKQDVRNLMSKQENNWYSFEICMFWRGRTHYRIDKLWRTPYAQRMFRYIKDSDYRLPDRKFACGHLPINIRALQGEKTKYRIKHLAYIDPDDIKKKYDYYINQDPNGRFHQLNHIKSIIDEDIVLEEWID